jgi:hypothetical protein
MLAHIHAPFVRRLRSRRFSVASKNKQVTDTLVFAFDGKPSRRHTPLTRVVLWGVLFVATSVFIASALHPSIASATAGIEQEMSFEGKIVTSAGLNIPDGNYNMEFKVYTGCTNNTGTGCTLAWTEDYLVSNSDGVSFTSGTYQVNLGQYCPFSGGTCAPTNANDGNTNTAINWNSYPLYLSLQIGNTSSCSPTGGNFTTACGGDGVMSPYVLLTSTPYSMNSNELGGLTSSQYVQTSPTVSQTIQPTSNVSSLLVEQNSSGSFGQDIFDVQGSSGSADDFLQITSTAANAGAATLQSLGSNALSLQSGGAVNIDTNAVANTIQIGNTSSAIAQTINIGANSTASSSDTIAIGNTVGGTLTLQGVGIKQTLSSNSDTVASVTNSSTAFEVQNASSQPIFVVGTSTTNLIVNPGF